MITISITILTLCIISIGLSCISLGMGISRLIDLIVDKLIEKNNSRNFKNKSDKSNNNSTESN